jgi:hypothetical protein
MACGPTLFDTIINMVNLVVLGFALVTLWRYR